MVIRCWLFVYQYLVKAGDLEPVYVLVTLVCIARSSLSTYFDGYALNKMNGNQTRKGSERLLDV